MTRARAHAIRAHTHARIKHTPHGCRTGAGHGADTRTGAARRRRRRHRDGGGPVARDRRATGPQCRLPRLVRDKKQKINVYNNYYRVLLIFIMFLIIIIIIIYCFRILLLYRLSSTSRTGARNTRSEILFA